MIRDTIGKIETRLGSAGINNEHKAELMELLSKLKAEIDGLAQTNAESAQSVMGFAEVSTHEATRVQKNPELLDASLKGFSKSVEELEGSHPQLVEVVNRICAALSNMGI